MGIIDSLKEKIENFKNRNEDEEEGYNNYLSLKEEKEGDINKGKRFNGNIYDFNIDEDTEDEEVDTKKQKNNNKNKLTLEDLLEELENAVYDSKRIPLTSRRIVDENLYLDILDDIKEEVNRLKHYMRSNRTLGKHEEENSLTVSERELLKNNPELKEVEIVANIMKSRARRYVSELLDDAEDVVQRTLLEIQANKKEL